mgnify:CR=1 FL=1
MGEIIRVDFGWREQPLSKVLTNRTRELLLNRTERLTRRHISETKEFMRSLLQEHGYIKVNSTVMNLLSPLVAGKKHEDLRAVARTMRALRLQGLAQSFGFLLVNSPHCREIATEALVGFKKDAIHAGPALITILEEGAERKGTALPKRPGDAREHISRKKSALRVIAAMPPSEGSAYFKHVIGTLNDQAHWQYLPELSQALAAMRHDSFDRLIGHYARARGWREPRRR